MEGENRLFSAEEHLRSKMSDSDSQGEAPELDLSNVRLRGLRAAQPPQEQLSSAAEWRLTSDCLLPCRRAMSSPSTRPQPKSPTVSATGRPARVCLLAHAKASECALKLASSDSIDSLAHARRGDCCRDCRVQGWSQDCGSVRLRRQHYQQVSRGARSLAQLPLSAAAMVLNARLAVRRECEKIFKGKNLEKGVAFPTCVSANR